MRIKNSRILILLFLNLIIFSCTSSDSDSPLIYDNEFCRFNKITEKIQNGEDHNPVLFDTTLNYTINCENSERLVVNINNDQGYIEIDFLDEKIIEKKKI